MDQRRWVQQRLRELSRARLLGRSVADAADTPDQAARPSSEQAAAQPSPQQPRSTDDTYQQPADPHRQPAH